MTSPDRADTHLTAAAALEELSKRRQQVVSEHLRLPPLWLTPLDMASVFGRHAARDLPAERRRAASTTVRVAENVADVLRASVGVQRVEVDHLWLWHALALD